MLAYPCWLIRVGLSYLWCALAYFHCVQAVFGVDISSRSRARAPSSIETRVVLEVQGGGVGSSSSGGPEEGAAGEGKGAEQEGEEEGGPRVWDAIVRFSLSKATEAVSAYIKCEGLTRAALGLERRGLRRLDAATVALVVRPPAPSEVRACVHGHRVGRAGVGPGASHALGKSGPRMRDEDSAACYPPAQVAPGGLVEAPRLTYSLNTTGEPQDIFLTNRLAMVGGAAGLVGAG